MMSGLNYVVYGCFSARTTPGVSDYRRLILEKNIIVVITQDRVIDANLKRQTKYRTLCTFRSYYPKFFNILVTGHIHS